MKKILLLLFIALPLIGYAKYYPVKIIYNNGSEKNVLASFPLPGIDDEIEVKLNKKAKKSKIQLKSVSKIELLLNDGADKAYFVCRKSNRLGEKKFRKKYQDYRVLSLIVEIHNDVFFSRAGNGFEIKKNEGIEEVVITYQVWFYSYIGKLDGDDVATFDIATISDESIALLVKTYFNNCQEVLNFLIANKKMKTTELKEVFSIYERCNKE